MSCCNHVELIYKRKLCSSCGMCEGMCPKDAIKYVIDKYGYFKPVIDKEKCVDCRMCELYCPGNSYYLISDCAKLEDNTQFFCAYSTNREVRRDAASGGLTTELLCYLLEKDIVDYCVVVSAMRDTENVEIVVTNSKERIVQCKSSKYCPIPLGRVLKEIKNSRFRYAIVGVPCQIQTIRNNLKQREGMIYISLFCNHCSSFNASKYLIYNSNVTNVQEIRHRGMGWPGNIQIIGEGYTKVMPFRNLYTRSFGRYFYNLRCRICNDPFGEFADISMADAFMFSEEENCEGQTFCMVRSEEISKILYDMKRGGHIGLSEYTDLEKIKSSFPSQFNRTNTSIKNIKILLCLYGKKRVPKNYDKLLEQSTVTITINFIDIIKFIRSNLTSNIIGGNSKLWKIIYKIKH